MVSTNLSHTFPSGDVKDLSTSLFKRPVPAWRLGSFDLDDLKGDLADDVGGGKLSGSVGLFRASRGFSQVLGCQRGRGIDSLVTYSFNDPILVI